MPDITDKIMKKFYSLLKIALKSAWNRRSTLFLIICAIAISTALLLGIEKIRTQVKENFVNSVVGTDLIIGARTSQIQLLLYSVFHIGSATSNMGYETLQKISRDPKVSWVIPVSLGDSHKSFPVVATDENFFKHFRYADRKEIRFRLGNAPAGMFDVAIGSEVAEKLNYRLRQKIHLTHGSVETASAVHDNVSFEISGIMSPTGTPIDRSIIIYLPAMEAIHVNWKGGLPVAGLKLTESQLKQMDLRPKSVTAAFIGLNKRSHTFAMQKAINEYKYESLMAVIPGVAIDELWNILNSGERVLWITSLLVTVSSLLGLVAVILAGLGQRRRELAILRSVGANPFDIILLMIYEGFIVVIGGVTLGLITVYTLIYLYARYFAENYGFFITPDLLSVTEIMIICGIFAAGFLASLIPAYKAYRISLSDGLNASI